MKQNNLRPSSFYWGICMIFTCNFLTGYFISKKFILLFATLVSFIFALVINHSKLKDKIDNQE